MPSKFYYLWVYGAVLCMKNTHFLRLRPFVIDFIFVL